MDINAIEQAIVDRLSPLRQAGLEVKALPDELAQFTAPRENGWVLVRFPEDSFEKPTQRLPLTQQGLLLCNLDVRLRSIRQETNQNCWAVLRLIRKLLVGYQPDGARGPIHVIGEQMQGSDKGYWHWFSNFNVPVLVRAQDDESDSIEPLLSQIVYSFEISDRWNESAGVDDQVRVD